MLKFSQGTKKEHEKHDEIAGVSPEFRTERHPNTSLEHYCYITHLGFSTRSESESLNNLRTNLTQAHILLHPVV
jgi:hypothetical protein